jgi:glycosyltransferase involved in cell wall biosynthesis
MTSQPEVGVVIPCYNHGRFVREAVDSALRQEDADVHVVVVDDGSNDDSSCKACRRCASDRVLVVRQDNRGLPAARNRGAREAAAAWAPEYLVFLDADDWLEPQFVSHLRGALVAARSAPGGGNVSHAYCQERLVELGTGIWRVPEWDPILLMITNLHPVTTLVRRECFEGAGGFDESMRGGYEDWDLWLRFAERGWRGVRVPEPLFIWRRHSPDTMVMKVIHNHEALFRHIVASHRDLYEKYGPELLVRMNTMMRRWDVNWIDETGVPIPLRALWTVRDEYESMVAVKLHHALHKKVNGLPKPLAGGVKRVMSYVKKRVAGV